MSLSQETIAVVDELARTQSGPSSLTVMDGSCRLTLNMELVTPVGIACSSLELTATDQPERSLDDLKAWGNRLSGRLTYLMEPLAIYEADATTTELCLRSQAPTRRDERRTYFEVCLSRDNRLRLTRYQYDEAERRRSPVASQFTREVIERLVDDLTASVV